MNAKADAQTFRWEDPLFLDGQLTEEERMVAETARGYALEKLMPRVISANREERFDREILTEMGELGLLGSTLPEEYGGAGLSHVSYGLIAHAIESVDSGYRSVMSVQSSLVMYPIYAFGTEEQRQTWLPKMCTMETLASYCLTEPGSGSDAAALKTKAERDGNQWKMNGAKAFISGGGHSDLYVVMARTGADGPKGISAMLVEDGTPGLSFGANERKMGWKAQPTAQVQFDDCKVPADHLLGEEGAGFKYAMAGLDGGRLNIAASARCSS